MRNILILGGTLEARRLAEALAARGETATLSLAGRTAAPAALPLPVRVGGFGGAEGLADHLRRNAITHLIDATHPFAAQISRNAVEAARRAALPLIALTRPAWTPQPGDNWREVTDIAAAVTALAGPPRRVFLALGRRNLPAFAAQPQHSYLIRLVDFPERPYFDQCRTVIARGPFTLDGDLALLRAHATELLVCKNAGGAGARAKLDAARALGLPVLMIARPAPPARRASHSVAEVLDWCHGAQRGV